MSDSSHEPESSPSSAALPDSSVSVGAEALRLADFQRLIRKMYYEKDVQRGADATFLWLMEEVGELAAAVRSGTAEERSGEFADVLAWLATIANVLEIDLAAAVTAKYGHGCPGCGNLVCDCEMSEKP